MQNHFMKNPTNLSAKQEEKWIKAHLERLFIEQELH